jgi:CHAT domain-containing protein
MKDTKKLILALIPILILLNRCSNITKSQTQDFHQDYFDSIYLHGFDADLSQYLDTLANSKDHDLKNFTICNYADHILSTNMDDDKVKKVLFKIASDTSNLFYEVANFDCNLYTYPENIDIEGFKSFIKTQSSASVLASLYNRVGQYYMDVDMELDSARYYYFKSYDLIESQPFITRQHFITYKALIRMSSIKRIHHEGIFLANLLCNFQNYLNPTDSVTQARALLLRANMLFRENDYEGSELDNSMALALIDTTKHNWEFQKYLENEYLFTNDRPAEKYKRDALLFRLASNIKESGKEFINKHLLNGRNLVEKGEYLAALPHLQSAMNWEFKSHFFNFKNLSQVCNSFKNGYKGLNQFDKAIKYMEVDIQYAGGRLKLDKRVKDYTFYSKLQIVDILLNKYQKLNQIDDLEKAAILLQNIDSIMWSEYKVIDEQSVIQFYTESGNDFFNLGIQTYYELYQVTKNEDYLLEYLRFADMRKSSLMFRDQILAEKSKDQSNPLYKMQLYQSALLKEANQKEKRGNEDYNRITKGYIAYERKLENQNIPFKTNFQVKSFKELDITKIQSLIKVDESIIDIVQHYTDVYYTIINPKSIEILKINLNSNTYKSIDIYLQSDNLMDQTKFQVISNNLFPKELKANLNKNLRIMPDGFFHRIPISYMLGNQYNVSYIPSLKFLKGDATEIVDHSNGETAVFAFSDKKTILQNAEIGLPELPGTFTEAMKIKQKNPSSTIFTGHDATKANFIKMYTNPKIKHIYLATHGYAVSDKKEDVKLYFRTQTGGLDSLYGYELLKYQSNAQKIVLSACETGVGKVIAGEGTFSLVRYFIINGAKEVVTTLQKVNDNIARERGDVMRYVMY